MKNHTAGYINAAMRGFNLRHLVKLEESLGREWIKRRSATPLGPPNTERLVSVIFREFSYFWAGIFFFFCKCTPVFHKSVATRTVCPAGNR